MKRICLAMCLFAFAPCAFATGEYMDAFLSHYKLQENAAFNDKSCGICHVSDSDFEFNPFGAAVKKALTDTGASAVDGTVLASIESLDSDGDGATNGEEIAAATFPGDPTSGAKTGTVTTGGATGDGAGILIQVPDAFLRAVCGFDLPGAGAYAVGTAFLPGPAETVAKTRRRIETWRIFVVRVACQRPRMPIAMARIDTPMIAAAVRPRRAERSSGSPATAFRSAGGWCSSST